MTVPASPLQLRERVTLRPIIEPDDGEFLEELYFSTRDDLNGLFPDPKDARQLVLMQQKAQAVAYKHEFPNATYELILFDGNRAGRIVIDRSAPALILVDIVLLPTSRNLGIGSAILDSLLRECRQNARPCVLSVIKTNRAKGLYARKGFDVIEDSGTHFLMRWNPGGEELL